MEFTFMKRTVFFISDGTGITAANLGHSLLTQFESVEFDEVTIPNVNNVAKAEQARARIQEAYAHDQAHPLVFTTLINSEISAIIAKSPGMVFDFFKTFIGPLEEALKVKSSHHVGLTHGLQNYHNYMVRINAVNYALANDDGINHKEFDRADFILVGVSRCGKTPTCLYLALHFGLFAANYPFTEEDIADMQIPKFLRPFQNKLYGLTINAERLASIRQERRPNSKYASLPQCRHEVHEVENLFKREHISYLDTTTLSIEEIAAELVERSGIKRRVY
jgi:regulator of PEP synthase PpsR (kinase-PPPase family)